MSREFIMTSTKAMTDGELRNRVAWLTTHKREGNEEFELRICEQEIVARFLGKSFEVNEYGFVEMVAQKEDDCILIW